MVLPGWANGILLTMAKEFLHTPPYDAALAHFTGGLPALPDISLFKNASEVTYLTARIGTTSPYTMYSMDTSGVRVESLNLQQPQYNIPENAHLTEVNASPHGAVHPRTYLLMFVRQDVLDYFNRPVPTDWEELLQLLVDHAAARAMAAAAGPAAAAMLPEHGLCVTTQPSCGRAGDLLAALAASVVQTRGTSQGYVYDLLQPPPAAEPLTDGPGWRYAASMFSRLLHFNAPGGNASDPHATLEDGASVLRAGTECPAMSPEFAEGSCLITFEWEA
ncbi:hypothetical protein HYH03_018315 [Edaphochlamys debaryana]|nr:hypothetical protein HYH03_018315 [Edaphochlamys debaryana]|eukprot:KAG2482776.1 hypothetical protein HYH03_018315 [Edaphochlamys debaryana]